MTRSSVDLPPPLGPSRAVSEPGRDLDRDVVEGDEVAERLVDVRGPDAHRVSSLGRRARLTSSATTAVSDEHESRRVGGLLVEVLVTLLHEQRHRLGAPDQSAGHDGDRAVLAERAGQREHDAVGERAADGRQGDAAERLARAGAERARPPAPGRRRSPPARARRRARPAACETKIVAITMPGMEKMMLMPMPASALPVPVVRP